ncbi:MAG: bifunctional phosphoribosylaminoimidazolecarboxamide formyltransferase/IMP cyclohydrolase [Acidobacteriota bacterium]
MKVRRALLSAYDKTGIVELGRRLASLEVELLSSGGTARSLEEAGLSVRTVSDLTGFPEVFGGRVKTLHPKVHGGLLFRRDDPGDQQQAQEQGIEPIDLVVINLYPFEETVSDPDASRQDIVEKIDIGGPAMLRAAAKNHAHVAVLVDPADYEPVLAEIESEGGLKEETTRRLAAKTFARTASYDAAIASWLGEEAGAFALCGHDRMDLRYGENPHQGAAAYRIPGEGGGVLQAELHQGKAISFNNVADLDAAWSLAHDFERTGCAIIKHANPCGAAEADTPLQALEDARACDPVSAFGGIYAFNGEVDGATVASMLEGFVECVIAPGYDDEARALFKKKKNVRVLQAPLRTSRRPGRHVKRIVGGLLVQDWDDLAHAQDEWKVVTKRSPTDDEREALAFAWRVARHVKSNAILFAGPGRTLGIGAGQMSRVDSVKLARSKAAEQDLSLDGSAVASDAFFPFRDGLDALHEAGASAVIQPGGSKRDDEVIAAADEHGIAMIFTGRRHFQH